MKDSLFKFIKSKKYFLLFIAITITVFALLFSDVLFFGKTLRGEPYAAGVLPNGPVNYQKDVEFQRHINDPGASSWYNDPNFVVGINQLKNGFLPWWNPFNGTGTPLLASLQSGIMFPPKLMILFFSQTPFMFDIYMIFRILVAFVFTYLFLRLLKISKPISYVGAFSFSFSGSLISYINLEHLNIDAFIPLYMFCAEYFLQKQIFKRWLLLVFAFMLLILGGFPEASLFAFILVNSYFLFRWFNLGRNLSILKSWIYANVVALLITSPVVIPFTIHMLESWTIHDPSNVVGTLFLPSAVLFSLVTPYFFNPTMLHLLNINPFSPIPGWIGGVVILLSLMALFNFKKEYRIGAFFALFGIVSMLKDFGFPFINWIGYLPIVSQAIVFKYLNPAMTFSLVSAAAFFLQYLLNNKSNKWQLLAGIFGFIIFYIAFILQFHHVFADFTVSRTLLAVETTIPKYLAFLIAITLIGLFTLLIVYLAQKGKSQKIRNIFVAILLLAILSEVYISLPKYHPRRDAGYPPVSFLTNLKNQTGSDYRVSGIGDVLYPDISSPYQLKDPRILDAMYLKGYYQFMKTLDPSFYDRFTSVDKSWVQNPSLLRALGVKYVLTTSPIGEVAAVTDLSKDFQLPKDSYTITGETRSILNIQPPFDKTFKIVFPKDTTSAYFYLAMSPKVWDPSKGDGVCVDVSYAIQKQTVCIEPQNNIADRVWKKVTISKPEGTQEVNLEIHINQLNSPAYDWVGMTDVISNEEAESINNSFTITSGFPVTQNNIKIFSYTLKDPKKIAYFPNEVNFGSSPNIITDVKGNLSKIDSDVYAEGTKDYIKQNNQADVNITMKLNGDLKINLPKNHPRYLYISQANHKNLSVTDEKGKNLNWYKANIGFVLVDTKGTSEVLVSNGPDNFLKLLFVGLFICGLSLIILYRFKIFIPFLKKL